MPSGQSAKTGMQKKLKAPEGDTRTRARGEDSEAPLKGVRQGQQLSAGGQPQMISSEPNVQKARKMLGGVKKSKASTGRFVRERESSSSSRSSAGEMMTFFFVPSSAWTSVTPGPFLLDLMASYTSFALQRSSSPSCGRPWRRHRLPC